MLRHVAGLAEIVEDVNEALAYYRDELGLTVEQQNGNDYAMITVPGILHFGVWDRRHAAESVYGSREHAERIPLGFTLEFEVDNIEDAAQRLKAKKPIEQEPRTEPWGQKTFRMLSPSGGLVGFAETPWARELSHSAKAAECE